MCYTWGLYYSALVKSLYSIDKSLNCGYNISRRIIRMFKNLLSRAIVKPHPSDSLPLLNKQLPESDELNKLRSLLQPLKLDIQKGPWIAGGAARLLYLKKAINGTGHDIDIFCPNFRTFKRTHKKLLKLSKKVFLTSGYNVHTYYIEGYKVQLIGGEVYPNIQRLLANFDFTVCQIATDLNNAIMSTYCHEDLPDGLRFPQDVNHYKIYSDDIHYRIMKYCLYGFTLSPNTLSTCVNVTRFSSLYNDGLEIANIPPVDLAKDAAIMSLSKEHAAYLKRQTLWSKVSNTLEVRCVDNIDYVFVNGLVMQFNIFVATTIALHWMLLNNVVHLVCDHCNSIVAHFTTVTVSVSHLKKTIMNLSAYYTKSNTLVGSLNEFLTLLDDKLKEARSNPIYTR